jgi:hypothetical protein
MEIDVIATIPTSQFLRSGYVAESALDFILIHEG